MAAGTAAGELGVKMQMEREIQIEYCRLVAEAKEKRRESAARGGSAAAGGGCAGAAGSHRAMSRPKRQCARREPGFYADIQGADLGNAGWDLPCPCLARRRQADACLHVCACVRISVTYRAPARAFPWPPLALSQTCRRWSEHLLPSPRCSMFRWSSNCDRLLSLFLSLSR